MSRGGTFRPRVPFAPMYSRAQNLPLTAQRRGSLVHLRIVVSGVVH